MIDYSKQLTHAIFNLSAEDSLRGLFHQYLDGNPLPSVRAIREIVELSRSIIFPGYFGTSKVNRHTVRYHIGVEVERLFDLLSDQISAAICFNSADNDYHARKTATNEYRLSDRMRESKASTQASVQAISSAISSHANLSEADLSSIIKPFPKQEIGFDFFAANDCDADHHEQGKECLTCNDHVKDMAAQMASDYIDSLVKIRAMLAQDVKAAFDADPAATSYGEVICCYPGIRAISNYRMAHALLKLGVPLIPRAITELAHSETGIDIHPGAEIGEAFAIDHGTGVVIGETCIIGHHVQLFQGVTLGAKSIPVDDRGIPMNVPRHPILEDNVVVYSNATILGRITIGKGAIIGGNVWVTEDVKPGSKVVQGRANR